MGSYYLDPFGCVKNQVDAEMMMAYLNAAGWEAAPDPDLAELIIVNSCGFIDAAKQESIDAVLAWRRAYPHKKILLAGCLAQRYQSELAESLGEADLLFGNGNLEGIAAALAAENAATTTEGPATTVEGPAVEAPERWRTDRAIAPGERPLLSLPGSAYVKIAEGCDNYCSFCAIPLIRGRLRSRSVEDILAECRALLGRGIRELCLIGQDLGSYGRDRSPAGSLPELLAGIAGLEGRFWVRLLYIHPDNFPRAILDICRRDGRFLPYFDLPFQHGSDRILRAMNRRGSAAAYLGLIDDIRAALPGAVIRSTFLTGFPGETWEDFTALLDFQERAQIDWAGAFAWSREEGTAAYGMKGRPPRKLAGERRDILEERQVPITESRMDLFLGSRLDVLVEEALDREEGLYLGRLYCQAPEVDGSALIRPRELSGGLSLGEFLPVKVIGRAGFDLEVRV
ncbi:MAG: 30S ribosomal protein S12 methylthiotransferase RimO [Treponema sp.]|nr:30S ribosomal protein S12 methylthiotransferase RimO [Treponema sp.]